MPKKIAFIGAGSFGFTRTLVKDILTFPALADAEQISGASQLQILIGNIESVIGFIQDVQSCRRFFRFIGVYENAVALVFASSHTSSQLVQLCQTETFRIFHHHDGCIGHIDAYLYYSCRNQYINIFF